MRIDISKANQAQVLAALYNRSKPQGMGFLHYTPEPMSELEAADTLAEYEVRCGRKYFDYLNGRVMKLNFDKPEDFGVRLYNRDIGEGAAEEVLRAIPGVEFLESE